VLLRLGNEVSDREITIGQLANRCGLAPSAIRFYESRGLISAIRTEGGQRRYGEDAALTLRQILFAQSAGFTLAEIADLLGPMESGEPLFANWQSLAEKKLLELDNVIERAQEMKARIKLALDCRCAKPENCGLLTGQR
jgi:MerR family redox-sensitive transcriptional activator SoxR